MADWHLAQINIGRLVAPLDDPRIAEFISLLAPVNALAERSPGYIWRLQTDSGNATEVPYNDDPFVIVNMSVWESIEALREFVYASHHIDVFRKRQQLFERMSQPNYCLWWVPAGHIPTVSEGRERLEHYQKHGATPFSFWFSKLYPAPEAELASVS
jgi:heme-degrading monooxygenase HmoA